MRRLIVNADDFGLTRGVNRAVIDLHRRGLLTSATLMARAAASEDAMALALGNPSLGVGCHVVLVDGEPTLPARSISTLARQDTGRLHPTPGSFLRLLLTGRISAAEIEAECAAQIALLKRSGLPLTHIDTHKHTHMFPAVLRPLLRAARAAGIGAVRNPFEPSWSRRATPTAPFARRIEVALLRSFEATFQRFVREEGMATTDGSLGVLATGSLDLPTINSLLDHLPPGTFELVTHPGYNDSDLAEAHTRLTASRQTEVHALSAIGGGAAIELINFGDLTANRPLATAAPEAQRGNSGH